MRVLLVHNSYQQHGGEDAVVSQEKSLLERAGHEVTLYLRSNTEIKNYSPGARLGLAVRSVWARDSRRDVARLLREHKPNVVHVHNTFVVLSPSIYSVCRDNGIPVVQTLHNYRLLCPAASLFRNGEVCEECVNQSLWRAVRHGCYHDRRVESAAVALMLALHRRLGTWTKDITCYIAISDFVREKFVAAGFPQHQISVKPNFVHPDPCPDSRHSNSSRNYAMFAGRLSPEKGVRSLLAAWQHLKTSIPLVIIGDGPERARLEHTAKELRLSSVRFRGSLSHAETLAAMKGARFLVFPSVWAEPFGLTIIEAMACRTPIICSRLGAPCSIVEEGRTGLHFNAGDAGDLADKVTWAWDRPDQMRSMGKAARAEYERMYTAEKNYPILMRIYDSACESRNAAGQLEVVPAVRP